MRRSQAAWTRVLGVGLTAALSAITIVLALTGRLDLYISPDGAWFAVGMAVIAVVGAVASFALPLGAEADHGHDHDHDVAPAPAGRATGIRWGVVATATGGVLATGLVAVALVTPPATLSAELAMSRDTGAPPLFQGADAVTLATTGDTSAFGVGQWAAVFATATDPEAFAGEEVTLTGFVTPGDGGTFQLTRLVITHCVIDAQAASVVVADATAPEVGQWVTVTGTIRDTGAALELAAADVALIDEPEDPYEY